MIVGQSAEEPISKSGLALTSSRQSHKVGIKGLADLLSERCKTHAYLIDPEDIEAVITEIAKLIAELDHDIRELNPEQGAAIEELQNLRELADGIRNRCFSLIDGFEVYGTEMKLPKFYETLSPLPAKLARLAELL